MMLQHFWKSGLTAMVLTLSSVVCGQAEAGLPADFEARVAAYRPPELQSGRLVSASQRLENLYREKNYLEALIQLRWLFDNALQYDSSIVGVRSSFWLAFWNRLGAAYPPAKAEMLRIRDEKEQYLRSDAIQERYAGKNPDGTPRDWTKQPPQSQKEWLCFFRDSQGDTAVFADVRAMNRELGEPQRTLALFRELDEKHPEFARRSYYYVESDLLNANETALLKKYLSSSESGGGKELSTEAALKKRWEYLKKRFERDTTLAHTKDLFSQCAPEEQLKRQTTFAYNMLDFHRNSSVPMLFRLAVAVGLPTLGAEMKSEGETILKQREKELPPRPPRRSSCGAQP